MYPGAPMAAAVLCVTIAALFILPGHAQPDLTGWPMDGHDGARANRLTTDGSCLSSADSVARAWSVDLPGFDGSNSDDAYSSIVSGGGHVCVGVPLYNYSASYAHTSLSCHDSATGASVWHMEYLGGYYGRMALDTRGYLYVPVNRYDGEESQLFAFNVATGARLWNRTLGDVDVYDTVVVIGPDGTLYMNLVGDTSFNILMALEGETGEILWNTTADNFLGSQPALLCDRPSGLSLFFAQNSLDDYALLSLNLSNGEILDDIPLTEEEYDFAYSSVHDAIYVVASRELGVVESYAAGNGSLLWTVELEVSEFSIIVGNGLALTGNDHLVVSQRYGIVILDGATGDYILNISHPYYNSSDPEGGRFISYNPALAAVDGNGNTGLFRMMLGYGGYDDSPATIFGFDAATGAQIFSQVAVNDDSLYFSTETMAADASGALYAAVFDEEEEVMHLVSFTCGDTDDTTSPSALWTASPLQALAALILFLI